MRAFTFLRLGALALALSGAPGCDIFLDDVGSEGKPCLDNGTCLDDLICNAERICVGCTPNCTQADARRCRTDEGATEQCLLNASGCLTWQVQQTCGANEHCELVTGVPSCEPGCTDNCGPNQATRCSGAVVQRCETDGACLRWTDVQDCSDDSQACVVVAGSAECGTCNANCPNVGDLHCNGNLLEICADAGGNCLVWQLQQNCTLNGLICEETGTPACVQGCTDACDEASYPACNGTVLETCVLQADGCSDLIPEEDCSLRGMGWTCDPGAVPPACVQACVPSCTQGTPNRCETHLLLEACDPITNLVTCYQWQPEACQQDDNCTPCDDATFDTVCDEANGVCVCAIPCGADDRTCCDASQFCDPNTNACATCALGETPCLDECCEPTSACVNGLCEPCIVDGQYLGCGDHCCFDTEVCTDHVAGTCTDCAGGILCLTDCCTGGDVCIQPGVCGPCPNEVCSPAGLPTCCGPGEVCNVGDSTCCQAGCEGLPCGPAPNPACGVALCGPSGGQACSVSSWSLTMGGADQEQGNFNIPSVALMNGNPWTLTWSNTHWTLLLAGFDSTGALLNQYLLEAGANPTGGVVRPAPSDNSLIIAGYTDSWPAGVGNDGMNLWLVKPSANLATVTWNKVYGTPDNDYARDLQPLTPSSAGYVVVGSSLASAPLSSGLVMRVALDGTPSNPGLIRFPDLDEDIGLAAVATLVDGGTLTGFVAVGSTASPPNTGYNRPIAIGLSPSLDAITWQIKLDNATIGRALGVIADGPDTVVLTGESRNPADSDLTDVFAVKLDAETGQILWQKTYTLSGTNEWGISIAQAPDNSLLLGAKIGYDAGLGSTEGWLLRISAIDGHLMWQRRYGGPNIDYFTMAIPRNFQDPLAGFLAVGSREVTGNGFDLWLLALDEAGLSPTCAGDTVATFTDAVAANHDFARVETDAELIPLSPAEFDSVDVTSGFTYGPDSTFTPVFDCP